MTPTVDKTFSTGTFLYRIEKWIALRLLDVLCFVLNIPVRLVLILRVATWTNGIFATFSVGLYLKLCLCIHSGMCEYDLLYISLISIDFIIYFPISKSLLLFHRKYCITYTFIKFYKDLIAPHGFNDVWTIAATTTLVNGCHKDCHDRITSARLVQLEEILLPQIRLELEL